MAKKVTDLQALNQTVRELYGSISFEKGRKPDLAKMKSLFISDAKLVNNNGPKPVVLTVDQFRAVHLDRLLSGIIMSFEEREACHVTEIFGKIAHRFSTYETRFDLNDPRPFRVGINSIQFVKQGDHWLVASLVWNDQTERLRIPRKYAK